MKCFYNFVLVNTYSNSPKKMTGLDYI